MMRNKQGLSMLELVIGMLFLTWVLLGYMSITSSAKQGAMDAYYEFLGFQVAREAIEVLESFGYNWLLHRYCESNVNPLGKYPLRTWHDVNPEHNFNDYPAEVDSFERLIETEKINIGDNKAIKITVYVKPRGQTKAIAWLNKSKNISLSTIVFEQPL